MNNIHRNMNASLIFIDPHGEAAPDLARIVPETKLYDLYRQALWSLDTMKVV